MAKHDRRKTSGQPPSSRTVTIQVPLPVLGVVNGVREAFHGFCIATGLQVLEAMMEADREVLCGAKGRHQVERPAWRGGSVDSQVTLGGRQVELPRLRVRSSNGEVPLASFQWAAATDPLDEHTLAADRRRGVDAPIRGHAGPGTGRCDRAGDVEQCRVAAVRGAVDKAPPGVSQPAVGRVGPAGGLHRRQGLPGPLHGDRVGDRFRRRHRDGFSALAWSSRGVSDPAWPVPQSTTGGRSPEGDSVIPRACKRLAEVDFPIAVVSKHAAREKSIRHGHPSTLHLWWARRPPGIESCRAPGTTAAGSLRRTRPGSIQGAGTGDPAGGASAADGRRRTPQGALVVHRRVRELGHGGEPDVLERGAEPRTGGARRGTARRVSRGSIRVDAEILAAAHCGSIASSIRSIGNTTSGSCTRLPTSGR